MHVTVLIKHLHYYKLNIIQAIIKKFKKEVGIIIKSKETRVTK